MYFDFKKLPEAQGLTKEQVQQVAKAAMPAAFKTPLGITGAILMALCVFFGLNVLQGMVGGAIGGGLGALILQPCLVNASRPAFKAERERRFPQNSA